MFSERWIKKAQKYRRLFKQYRREGQVKCSSLDRPIFIWGAPCSGTTLLYQLLAKHPAVGYPQTAALKPREGTYVWWRAFGEHRGVMDRTLLRPKAINQLCAEYAELLERQKKFRLLDKTPFMTLWASLIDEIFPTALHVHVIRDGRAVVNSILYKLRYSTREKHQRFQQETVLYGPIPPELVEPMTQPQAQRHARQWLQLVRHGQRNKALLGERYLEIRYEDLVENPAGLMKQVLNHVQLDYSDPFIAEAFPAEFTNRNYKWQSTESIEPADGFTMGRAFLPEDEQHLAELTPFLRSLGYSIDADEN